jgi:hypothetical protein
MRFKTGISKPKFNLGAGGAAWEKTEAGRELWHSRVMTRQLRMEYAGALYHLMKRGERQKARGEMRLRRETATTLTWMAGRLKMAAAGSLANRPRTMGRNETCDCVGLSRFLAARRHECKLAREAIESERVNEIAQIFYGKM